MRRLRIQPGKRAFQAADRVLSVIDGQHCLRPGVQRYKQMLHDCRFALASAIGSVYRDIDTMREAKFGDSP